VKEAELDQAFAGGRIDDAGLHRILADIGLLQGELRYTHLQISPAACLAPTRSPSMTGYAA